MTRYNPISSRFFKPGCKSQQKGHGISLFPFRISSIILFIKPKVLINNNLMILDISNYRGIIAESWRNDRGNQNSAKIPPVKNTKCLIINMEEYGGIGGTEKPMNFCQSKKARKLPFSLH